MLHQSPEQEEEQPPPVPTALVTRVLLVCVLLVVVAVSAAVVMGRTDGTSVGLVAVSLSALLYLILGDHPPRIRIGKWFKAG